MSFCQPGIVAIKSASDTGNTLGVFDSPGNTVACYMLLHIALRPWLIGRFSHSVCSVRILHGAQLFEVVR